MLILGMDLGKSKSAWELLDTNTGEVRRGKIAMSEHALRQLLTRLRPDQFVVESCALAARAHDLACELNVPVLVADATQDAWRWKNVKRKTDADDAGKLARLAALGQINPVHIPTPAVRERRHLIEYRRALVDEQTRCKNRIRATLTLHDRALPAGKNGWTDTARERLAAETRPLDQCGPEELWRGLLHEALEHLRQVETRVAAVTAKLDRLAAADPKVKLLRTIGGVGPRTAEIIVTALDEPRRFRSRREVGSYAGLTPRLFQSDTMKRDGRITKRGNPLLRQALNQAAWMVVRQNPEWRACFLRLGGGEKRRKKIAIVAVMRKLLVVAWAMLRDGRPYEPGRQQPQASSSSAA